MVLMKYEMGPPSSSVCISAVRDQVLFPCGSIETISVPSGSTVKSQIQTTEVMPYGMILMQIRKPGDMEKRKGSPIHARTFSSTSSMIC